MTGACHLGIDPGNKGALAFLWPADGVLAIYNIPLIKTTGTSRVFTEVDGAGLAELIKKHNPTHGCIERVHSREGEGPVGAFTFGMNFGALVAVTAACGVNMTKVEPGVWKANLRVPADKNEARDRAGELFPECKTLFSRPDKAEAAMIGLYGVLHGGHVPKRKFFPFKEQSDGEDQVAPRPRSSGKGSNRSVARR